MSNQRGKTLSIFIGLTMVLLVSSTAIGFFLYAKEFQARQQLEKDLEDSHATEAKLQADLKEVRRQLNIMQDKHKEADEKINNLLDEMDLNDGLRKELKAENASIKEQMGAAQQEQQKIRTELGETEKKYKELLELLKAEQEKSHNLQDALTEAQKAKTDADAKVEALKEELKPYSLRSPDFQTGPEVIPPLERSGKIELDRIVVDPNEGVHGRVLSVDKEAEFIVCSLGLKQGLKSGDVLSVYRGEEYLGDVRVSRVQEELCAADIIPPFSSRKVRKNDNVVFRP